MANMSARNLPVRICHFTRYDGGHQPLLYNVFSRQHRNFSSANSSSCQDFSLKCHAQSTSSIMPCLRSGTSCTIYQRGVSFPYLLMHADSFSWANCNAEYFSYWIAKFALFFGFLGFGFKKALCQNSDESCNESFSNIKMETPPADDYFHVRKEDFFNDINDKHFFFQKHGEINQRSAASSCLDSDIERTDPNALKVPTCKDKSSLHSNDSNNGKIFSPITVPPNSSKSLPSAAGLNNVNPNINISAMDGKAEAELDHMTKLKNAVQRARQKLGKAFGMAGASGGYAIVTVDGNIVFELKVGVCDFETSMACYSDSSFRIASISKPLTALIAMSLYEQGLLDLDKPIRAYLPQFPRKFVNGEEVHITSRHLLSHTSGIRHYLLKRPESENSGFAKAPQEPSKLTKNKKNELNKVKRELVAATGTAKHLNECEEKPSSENFKRYVEERRKKLMPFLNHQVFVDQEAAQKRLREEEANLFEFYINQPFKNTQKAIELFQDDELFFKPGSSYLYSTHGYTLLSRVLEAATGQSYTALATALFADLGLKNTILEKPDTIVHNKAQPYERDHQHVLRHAPQVDNSCKYAGGGLLSTADDLASLGNEMLLSLYSNDHLTGFHKTWPGYLKSSSARLMFSPYLQLPGDELPYGCHVKGYGLGWQVRLQRGDIVNVGSSSDADSCRCGGVVDAAPLGGSDVDGCHAEVTTSLSRKSQENDGAANAGHVDTASHRRSSEESTDRNEGDRNNSGVNCKVKRHNGNKMGSPPGGSSSSTSAVRTTEVRAALGHPAYKKYPSGRQGYIPPRSFPLALYHTGAAVGGSSVLLIVPDVIGSKWKIDWEGKTGERDRCERCGACDKEGSVKKECGDGRRSGEDLKESIEGVESKQEKTDTTVKGSNEGKVDMTMDDFKSSDLKKGKSALVLRRCLFQEQDVDQCHLCQPSSGDEKKPVDDRQPYKGIVVVILSNFTGVDFTEVAFDLAAIFRDVYL